MLAKERARRQGELEKSLLGLSEKLLNEEEIRLAALKLLDIYEGNYRHGYSGFFPLIVNVFNEKETGGLDSLCENLEKIKEYVENDFETGKHEFKELYGPITKLCDHLNTEIGRWSYYAKNEQKISDVESSMTDIKVNMSQLSKQMMDASEELQHASKQAASIQTELIAVLSIFSAIVVTFSGGFTFLGSAMTSVGQAECYEAVILSMLICGAAIFNTIFLMMYLVSKITERNIYARCLTPDCSCGNKQGDHKCNGIRRIQKRLPYVFYFNLFCGIGILVTLLVWIADIKFGWI